MESKNRTPSLLEWVSALLAIGAVIYQISHLQGLFSIELLNELIIGLGITLGVLLLLPFIGPKLPGWIYGVNMIVFWVSQIFDWTAVPTMLVVFLFTTGGVLYAFAVQWNLNWTDEGDHTRRTSALIFAMAGGIVFGRMLIMFDLTEIQPLITAIAVVGTILTVMNLFIAQNKFPFVVPPSYREHLLTSVQAMILVLAVILLFETAFLPNMLYSSSLKLEIYFLLQFIIMGGAIAVHFIMKGEKVFCPIVFALFGVLFLVFKSNATVTLISTLIFEMVMINILFLYPLLPRTQSPFQRTMNYFLSFTCWVLAIIIFLGGQFVFPHGDPALQMGSLILVIAILVLTWIKPRFLAEIRSNPKTNTDHPSDTREGSEKMSPKGDK